MAGATAIVATGLAGLFEGAAAYNYFCHPVPYYYTKEEDGLELLREWRRMFPPAAKFQGSLAALGALSAGATAALSGDAAVAAAFGLAAAFEVVTWAYTMVKLMPLNRTLLPKGGVEGPNPSSPAKHKPAGKPPHKTGAEIKEMLQEWGRMHSVRVVLGAGALGSCLVGLKLMLK